MTLVRSVIRDLAVEVLLDLGTVAGKYVFGSRDTSLQQGDVPAVLVYILSERGEGMPGRTEPQFRTTLTLVIDCLAASTNLRRCETMLDALSEQVTEGLLRSPKFVGAKNPDTGGKLFEGFSDLVVTVAFSGEGDRHNGTTRIALGIRFHDVYPPLVLQPLTTIGLNTDTIQPADQTGTYLPAYPAPRTQGPDGRIDIGGVVTLPQP